MYASQFTPIMTTAGMLHYQALPFSHFHLMILCATKAKITESFGRFTPDLTLFFLLFG